MRHESRHESRTEGRSDSRSMFDEMRRKKVCRFCERGIEFIDYKDDKFLRRLINDRSKIVSRRSSGNCAYHQRQVTTAIKRARHLALLPFTSEIHR